MIQSIWIWFSFFCTKISSPFKTETTLKQEIFWTKYYWGAFCKFPIRWIFYYGSTKSTGKTHLCVLFWFDYVVNQISLWGSETYTKSVLSLDLIHCEKKRIRTQKKLLYIWGCLLKICNVSQIHVFSSKKNLRLKFRTAIENWNNV